jgi:hypothetical protein
MTSFMGRLPSSGRKSPVVFSGNHPTIRPGC